MICSSCGTQNPDAARFCNECGAAHGGGSRSLGDRGDPPVGRTPDDAVYGRALVEPPRPGSGYRYGAPDGGPQYDRGPVAQARPNRKLSPLALGAALLLIIAGVTIGTVAWLRTGDDADQPTGGERLRAVPDREHVIGRVSKQQQATITPADAEFIKLTERRHHATDADHAEIAGEFKAAEARYPTDYRFPYEHARMEVSDPPPHDEVIGLLFTAGRKAIDAGKADEMLSDLVKEQGHEFREFSGEHKQQWKTLIEALRGWDKSELKVEHHH